MLLCVDVGNTQIALGLYATDAERPAADVETTVRPPLLRQWRMRTDPRITADELEVAINAMLGPLTERITGVAALSTVPSVLRELRILAERRTGQMPTVIVEPPATVRVSREEVFGPVTCVYAYTDLDEAIARANSLPFAFQASVFARDIDVALKAARLLDASAVLVNDHTAFRTDWMPFAGRHQSGYNVGGIPYTMHDMTQDKMIVVRW